MGDRMEEDQGVMRIGRRCYVGNLSGDTSWQDLKDKFRECGRVVYTQVRRDTEGVSKGWGIVEFETPEEAVNAVRTMDGEELNGSRIMVREDREDRDVKQYMRETMDYSGYSGRPMNERGYGGRGRGRDYSAARREGESSGLQVVVQGIPWRFTWKELKSLFEEDFPDVDRADVVIGADGRSRGYGTVRFRSQQSAEEAIQKYHGSQFDGRILTIFIDKFA